MDEFFHSARHEWARVCAAHTAGAASGKRATRPADVNWPAADVREYGDEREGLTLCGVYQQAH